MGWLYLLAALVMPPVFVLWRPHVPLGERERKVRLAGSVVVVWMLMILWSLRGAIAANSPNDTQIAVRDFTPATQPDRADEPVKDTSYDWTIIAPPDTGLVLALGWVPGLAYAALLLLSRKKLERPDIEVIDFPGGPYGRA